MCRILPVWIVFAGVWMAAAQSEAPSDANEIRHVTVTAEGYDKDDALKQALRKALEQGAGTQIAAFSQVENYTLIRDTIYSRASGIVSDYRIVKGPSEVPGGTWEVTIEAQVRQSAVAETWGEVQNVLDQLGRPKIMVWIDERIDGQLQKSSVVESRIEELFVKAGFDLVAREAVDSIRRREAQDAAEEKNWAKQARIAKDAGAHIFIRGYANANQAGLEDLYGVPAAFYNCDVSAKIYATDTGKLIASESIPATRRGVRSRRSFSPQAARTALVSATFPRKKIGREPALAVRLFESAMEQWSTQISAGGEIVLEVEGMTFKAFVTVRRALGELKNVRKVDGDFTKGTGVYRIQAQMTAQTLAEQLIESPFEEWVEVVDLKASRIQAKAVPRD